MAGIPAAETKRSGYIRELCKLAKPGAAAGNINGKIEALAAILARKHEILSLYHTVMETRRLNENEWKAYSGLVLRAREYEALLGLFPDKRYLKLRHAFACAPGELTRGGSLATLRELAREAIKKISKHPTTRDIQLQRIAAFVLFYGISQPDAKNVFLLVNRKAALGPKQSLKIMPTEEEMRDLKEIGSGPVFVTPPTRPRSIIRFTRPRSGMAVIENRLRDSLPYIRSAARYTGQIALAGLAIELIGLRVLTRLLGDSGVYFSSFGIRGLTNKIMGVNEFNAATQAALAGGILGASVQARFPVTGLLGSIFFGLPFAIEATATHNLGPREKLAIALSSPTTHYLLTQGFPFFRALGLRPEGTMEKVNLSTGLATFSGWLAYRLARIFPPAAFLGPSSLIGTTAYLLARHPSLASLLFSAGFTSTMSAASVAIADRAMPLAPEGDEENARKRQRRLFYLGAGATTIGTVVGSHIFHSLPPEFQRTAATLAVLAPVFVTSLGITSMLRRRGMLIWSKSLEKILSAEGKKGKPRNRGAARK
jgi:hypothetical protein